MSRSLRSTLSIFVVALLHACASGVSERRGDAGEATDGAGEATDGAASDDACVDVCAEGQTRCGSSAGSQTCERQASGCLDWGGEVACPGGACSAGRCEACPSGERRCEGDALELCEGGAWTFDERCPLGCDEERCATRVSCRPGSLRCLGSLAERCNATGTAWLTVEACAEGCSAGLCEGDCETGTRRCRGAEVEECGADGAYRTLETCATSCLAGACALPSLEVTSPTLLEGEVFVDGDVVIASSLRSLSGDLTIHARSITVSASGSITVDPTGDEPDGRGGEGVGFFMSSVRYGGGGGGYGGPGLGGWYGSNRRDNGGPAWGSALDGVVSRGSAGGRTYRDEWPELFRGGGVVRLVAEQITIEGSVRADGERGNRAGSGSGGGVLLAGDVIRVAGTVSAAGGGPTASGALMTGGAGGPGRVKLLYGTSLDTSGATIVGVTTTGLLPPLEISSSTHPDPELWYNDGASEAVFGWTRPFGSPIGYYWIVDSDLRVPTAATGTLVTTESLFFSTSALSEGEHLVQLVPVSAESVVGTVESSFRIRVNGTPPVLASSSHGDGSSWAPATDVLLTWTSPRSPESSREHWLVVDRRGDTIPTHDDMVLPASRTSHLLLDVPPGIHAAHVVSVDAMGNPTRAAGHFTFRVGPDPGEATLTGTVTDAGTGAPVPGVEIVFEGGLLGPAVSGEDGRYTCSRASVGLAAGAWEVTFRAAGYAPVTRALTLSAGESRALDVALAPR